MQIYEQISVSAHFFVHSGANFTIDRMKTRNKQLFWWLGALVVGTVLGLLHVKAVDAVCGRSLPIPSRTPS